MRFLSRHVSWKITSNPLFFKIEHEASEPRRIIALCWSVTFIPSTLFLKNSAVSKKLDKSVPLGGSISAVTTNFFFSRYSFKLIYGQGRLKFKYRLQHQVFSDYPSRRTVINYRPVSWRNNFIHPVKPVNLFQSFIN